MIQMRRADVLALVVALVGVGIYVAVARVAYLRGDDWILLSIVTSPDFGPADLFLPYGSHVMPFGLFTFWAAVALFGPAPWWPLVAVGIALVAVALFFTWASIRLLVGPDDRAVAGFAVAAWGPAGLAAVMWPSPLVYQAPLWACTAAALYAFLRGRLRAGRWGYWVLLCLVLGLLAVETTLLIVPLLFLVAAAWFERGGPVVSVTRAWRSARSFWLAAGALVAVYAAVYFTVSSYAETLPGQRAGADLIVEGSLLAVGKVGPALLLAGPWSWTPAMAPTMNASVPIAVVMFAVAALVVHRGRRAGWRAWIPMVGLLLLTVVVLSAARLAVFGSSALLNPYYYVEGLTVLAVTLAVAFLPSRLPIDGDRAGVSAPLFVAAGSLLLVSALAAASTYAQAVPSAPGRAYLEAARQSLQQPTLNTDAPRAAFGVFVYSPPFDSAAHTLALAGVDGEWVDASVDPYMLDSRGRRVPAGVEGLVFDHPGGCLPLDTSVELAMPEGREPNRPTYRMHYVATRDTRARVQIGDRTWTLALDLPAGDRRVFFPETAVPDSLTVSAPDACLLGLVVGQAAPRA
ncbi:MAG: hypothetical protein H6528_08000 [Actinobacteria bacterium]|nr:hypothetical protein [Actinomycetota bacterium]MCB8997223.1 hypothetical protein [Actinomycetota bacterium]MCB9423535.1 hypothetical protein [Actinomycetota bacterium]HRY10912.1 hypothetical protein [Candidatus Nanopelagicales bacterium]